MQKYFKTKKRLEIALANAHRIKGLEEYLQQCMTTSHDIVSDTNTISYELPHWLETETLNNVNPDSFDFAYEYIHGYHVTSPRVGDSVDLCGGMYEVIDIVPLSEELELSAETGEYCYYYIGQSYLKVYQRLAD
jgi:hypothetical protein